MNIEDDRQYHLIVEAADQQQFKRLDQFLAEKSPELSRTFIKKLFELGMITSDSKLNLKKMPPAGTQIHIDVPPPIPSKAEAEDLPLEILYEDEHLLFINKAAGMVTHPAPGNYTGTLVNAVLFHCKDLTGVGNEIRPGIVHRLDKGTSGVMVVAKTQKCHEGLVELFSKHDLDRRYEALVLGQKLDSSGTIETLIGRNPHNRLKMTTKLEEGKKAIGHYRLLDVFEQISHLEFKLETGRTHQIRVHCAEVLSHPILCDPTYGNLKDQQQRIPNSVQKILKEYPHPLLHARSLELVHPISKKLLSFRSEPPPIFSQALTQAKEIL